MPSPRTMFLSRNGRRLLKQLDLEHPGGRLVDELRDPLQWDYRHDAVVAVAVQDDRVATTALDPSFGSS